MKYRAECLIPAGLTDLNALIVRWLSWLPIWEDGEETDHVYGYLCDLVEANNPAVLGGPSNTNLPRIVAAIARVFSEKSLFRPDEEEGSASASAASGGGDKQVNGAKSTPGTPSVYDRCVSILRLIQVRCIFNCANLFDNFHFQQCLYPFRLILQCMKPVWHSCRRRKGKLSLNVSVRYPLSPSIFPYPLAICPLRPSPSLLLHYIQSDVCRENVVCFPVQNPSMCLRISALYTTHRRRRWW